MSMQLKKHSPLQMQHQKGVALITILLIVVMAVALAATLLAKQDRLIHEAQVFLRGDQALSFALGAEVLAVNMLTQDAKINQTDSDKDVWAQPIPDYEVQDGQVSARIIEQSNKFNLNNLYHDGAVDKKQLAYFRRLLGRLGVQPELAAAVLDWQDPDDKPSEDGGAESDFYKSLTIDGLSATVGAQSGPKVLPPNQPFASIRELAFVHGVNREVLELLLPYVTAQPTFAPINVNTAEPIILAALDDDIDDKQLTEFVKSRQNRPPLESVDDFFSFGFMQNTKEAKQLKYMLSVESRYFQSQALVTLSNRKRYLRSELVKHNGVVSVYARDNMPFSLSPEKRATKS